MKNIFFHFLLIISFFMGTVSAVETNEFMDFDAVYDVYRGGLKIAKMKRVLTINGIENSLYSETKTTGIVSLFRKDKIIEKSIWESSNGKLVPKFYEYLRTGSKKDRNVTVEFDWHKNQVTNSVNGDSWKMAATEGMLDKLLYQLSIMMDLKQGKSTLNYQIADGGKEKNYIFEVVGEEVIDTKLGELNTIKLKRKRNDSDRESIFWSAPDMHYLPVKIEITDDGDKTVVIINSLNGLEI